MMPGLEGGPRRRFVRAIQDLNAHGVDVFPPETVHLSAAYMSQTGIAGRMSVSNQAG